MADPETLVELALINLAGFFADLLADFFAGFADRMPHAVGVFTCAFNGVAGGEQRRAEDEEASEQQVAVNPSQQKAAVVQRVAHSMFSKIARPTIGTPREP